MSSHWLNWPGSSDPSLVQVALIYKPLQADDPKQRQPNIGFAKEAMGWEPGIRIEEDLKPTIAYF